MKKLMFIAAVAALGIGMTGCVGAGGACTTTALFGGIGLWSAWPVAEALSLVMTALVLHRYQSRYQY